MQTQPLQIGEYERYIVSQSPDPETGGQMTRWVWAKVLNITPDGKLVQIRALGDSRWSKCAIAQWVTTDKLF